MSEPKEPKLDYQEWLIKKVVPELTELRDTLRQLQVKNTIRTLDNMESFVLQSQCSEANKFIKHIMEK